MEIFKIVGVGLLTCFLSILIKQIKPEFYFFVLISGGAVIILLVLDKLTTVISYFFKLFEKTKIDPSTFFVVLKIIGIAFLTEFAAGICVDSGNASIGDKVIFAGKIIILFLSLPIFTNLIEIIIEMLQ